MNSPERLALLAPLVNGDALTVTALRRCVFQFLHGFEAPGLRLPGGQQELWDAHDASEAELKAVAAKVERVFFTWMMFDGPQPAGLEHMTPDDMRQPLNFPSLRFGAYRPPRRARVTLTVEAGRLRDLVPYLAMYLLTTGAMSVSRCTAPARGQWRSRCGRIVIWQGSGRPGTVCSRQCADRVKAKRKHERAQRDRQELEQLRKAAGRKRR